MDNKPTETRPFAFASTLNGGIVLLAIGFALLTGGAGAGIGALVVVGALTGLVGLVLTMVGVGRQAEAIEAIAAALNVTREVKASSQQTNAEFFRKD